MASEQSHREQAELNQQAAQDLRDTKPDWAVTMCFYSALHWVEFYAKTHGCDNLRQQYPGRSLHESRTQYVDDLARDLGNRTLRKAYEELERTSKKSRYLQNINTNSREFFKKQKKEVNKSFENLRVITQLLS